MACLATLILVHPDKRTQAPNDAGATAQQQEPFFSFLSRPSSRPQMRASSRLKTDVVFMKNGDRITCEIRSLEQGQLTVKQEYATSTVVFDWNKVDNIQTKQPFVVVDDKGDAFSGHVSETADEHVVTVEGAKQTNIPHDEVVSIQQTGETFLRKLRGDVDLGLSFAQSNAQKNLTLDGDLNYQATTTVAGLSAISQFTSQKEVSDTNETTLKSEYFKQLRKSDWYGGAIANFLSSSEQQIDLRTTLGGALASARSTPTKQTFP